MVKRIDYKENWRVMKIKKFLTTFFVLLICVFCCVGCGEVQFNRAVYADNKILDQFVINLNKTAIDNSGKISAEELVDIIYEDLNTFRQYVEDWTNSFKDDYPDVHLALMEGLKCEVFPDPDTELSVSIEFANWGLFGMFYGISNIKDVEYEKAVSDVGPFIYQIAKQDYQVEDFGLFLQKYAMVKDDGVYSQIEKFKIDAIDVNYYEKYSNLTGFELEDCEVWQVFAYPDDRLYANADEKEVVENMTYFAWNLSDKSEDFQMSIYKIAPKSTIWYVLALFLSLATVIIVWVILKIKSNKRISMCISKKDVEKDER